jgi:urocanate hydratase
MEGKAMTPTTPIFIFKTHLAAALQKPPHSWVGHAAYELMSKYSETISQFWANGATAEDAAEAISEMHMEYTKPQAFSFPDPRKVGKIIRN